ncbi:helix-turn-helix family protein [Paraburkholderia xenovorans LB400]|jgi:HTH-type transcriptional regulator / antitoxin HipB|uniref:Transcriptional regulator, XRE family n=1 Tax=Paraburkholderia xenovorans (strain LB400) TaxID=266265 RepID=Q13N80_PARXL|nr:helix-turn-helix domain-containing protein [Paraburkholderia xenovorans]ABE34459.1 transcriptional regulator, XRE family [Paraburkholderia xenovorans LB400]AIP36049.1 helix-turn-helix family protein [Paraburkholderia xenovorans LB400]NPT33259.1 helix-turn-helix domain-containing protein [Paraburkholderia xenovorans]
MPAALPSQPLVTAPQLGQLLVASRKRRKLTQAEVARRVGLSQNRISYLEKNPDELSFKQLLSWCSAIGLELRLGERDAAGPKNVSEW